MRTRLLVMCASVGIAIDEACIALKRGDSERARAVVEGDDAIDAMENDIDKLCLSVLVRNQPFAQDLRFVVAALRIVVDLERIGDEAVSVAERVMVLGEKLPPQMMKNLEPLMDLAQKIYRDAVNIFQHENAANALELRHTDDESAQLEVHVLHDLVGCFGKESCEISNWHVLHSILISRSLNRICRRASNIVEQTYFIAQGVNLKHAPSPEV